MSNENLTTTEAVSAARGPSLSEKKAWFRMAHPNGGMVLNPLRVTDQMAIFEARLFADTGDHTPLASFTASRSADKATGKQYIRAAQEDALNEALDNAGFGVPPHRDAVPQESDPEHPSNEVDAPQETNDVKELVETPPAVLDISTGKPVETEKESAVVPEPVPEPPVAETQEKAPGTYTADMTVEEICQVMTLEQAKGVTVRDGTCKGWTLEQVARDRPASLKWFQIACPFADNVLKAAAKIVLADLELKMAG